MRTIYAAKARIMRRLNEFYGLFDARTLSAVAAAQRHSDIYIIGVFVMLGLLLSWFVFRTASCGERYKIWCNSKMRRGTSETVDYVSQFEIDSNDEIGNLSRAFTAAQMERDRYFNQSLNLACHRGVRRLFQATESGLGKVLGFPQEELLSRPFIDLVSPGSRTEATAELEKLLPVFAISFESRDGCKDGSFRWILWNITATTGCAGILLFRPGHHSEEEYRDRNCKKRERQRRLPTVPRASFWQT